MKHDFIADEGRYMTIEEFEKEIEEIYGWMKDSTTCPNDEKDREAVMEQISELYNSDVYEVHADFHLSNGDIIKTSNHCLKSFYRCMYSGDYIFVQEGWLYIEHTTEDGIFHQSRVKPESVCWIDQYVSNVNWQANLPVILRELGING